MSITRRGFITALSSAALITAALPRRGLAAGTHPALADQLAARLRVLEEQSRGRLGVHIVDTADGRCACPPVPVESHTGTSSRPSFKQIPCPGPVASTVPWAPWWVVVNSKAVWQ